MGSFFLRLFVVCAVSTFAACASKQPKSSSRIYEGDSPSITYMSERETAGGAVGGR